MKKLLSLTFALLIVASAGAQSNKWWWNSVGKVLPASKWNPADTYKVDAYVINTGTKYESAYYNHIWGVPPTDANGKAWYELGYSLTGGTDENGTAVEWAVLNSPFSSDDVYNGMQSSKWINSEIMGEFYGRRTFTIADGTVLPTTLYLSCGHDDAPCEYYLNGTLIWTGTDGWNEGEIVQLTSEQRALIKTDGTENVLAFHVHQNWGGAYADCGLYGEPQSYKFIVPTSDQTEAGWSGFMTSEDFFSTDGIEFATSLTSDAEDYMDPITGAISDQTVPNNISAYTQYAGENTDCVVRRHFTIDEPLPTDGWEYYVIVAHDDIFTLWLNGSNGNINDSYIYDASGNVVEGSGNRTTIPMPDDWTTGVAADPHVLIPYTGNCWVDYPSKRIRKLTDEQLALLNIGADKDNVFTVKAHNTSGGFYVDMGIIGVQTKLTVSYFTEQLQALIAEIETYMQTANPTDAALKAMNAALEEARAALTTTSVTEASEALGKLQEVYNTFKGIDKTVLESTITVSENDQTNTEFADELAAAKTAVTDATTADELNNALSNLQVARRIAHADKSENTFTSAEPVDDGEFYLYNVGQKRWLCGGGDWGAHAALGYPGIVVTLEHDTWGEGTSDYKYYAINTHLSNGDWDASSKLGHGGYMDSAGNAWMFWKQANGTYTISRNGDADGNNDANGEGTKQLLGYQPNTYCDVNTDLAGADDPNNQWILVTREMRDNLFKEVKAQDDYAEATYFISMPGFNQRERAVGSSQADDILDWTFEGANIESDHYNGRHVIYGRNENHDDFVVDIYEQADFNMYQTIYDLPNGNYRVGVNAYYRAEQPEADEEGATTEWTDPHSTTVFYVNNGVEEKTQPILDISAGAGKYPGVGKGEGDAQVPSTGFDATKYFQVGEYYQYLDCTVSNGELTIGVRKHADEMTKNECLIVDNFRLTYFGEFQPTGISDVKSEKAIEKSGRIYNINGQYEGTNLNSLPKGIHIVGGKKIVR